MTHPGADDARPARRRRSIFRDDSDDLGLRDAWGDPTPTGGAAPTVATDDPDGAPSIFRAGLPDSPPADPGHPDGVVR